MKKQVKKETNYFGYQAWTHHISYVVKNAKLLARELKADEEIVELAALLHDYASILNKDWYPEHHRHGVRLAGKILKNYGYPKEKIEKVKHCILAHRASRKIAKKTIEAKILASRFDGPL